MSAIREFVGYTKPDSDGTIKSNSKATTLRSVVLHLKYILFILLGGLVWASFTVEQGTGIRKDECGLYGTLTNGCAAVTAAQKTQNETLYGLAISVTILNAGLLLLSIFTHHYGTCAKVQYHIVFRVLVSVVNIGLFAALVSVFREDDDDNNGAKLLTDANLENNVYFKETFNPYASASSGLALVLLDAVLGTGIIYGLYGERCKAPDNTEGSFGEGE